MLARLEVVCGPMFSGKTEELIRRLTRAQFANKKTLLIKPITDDRYSISDVYSHSGSSMEACPIEQAFDLFSLVDPGEIDIIGIDEVQFFDVHIVPVIEIMVNAGTTVIASGLETNYRFESFGSMAELLIRAEKVDKLTAICSVCGEDATRTQRLINGNPAPKEGPIILIGGTDSYEARCRKCHKIG